MTTTLHETQPLHDLPPLHITTVGIPPDEHITAHEAHLRERALWHGSDRIAVLALWALVLGIAFVVVALVVPARITTPTGQGTVAWTDYRSGEQSSTYLTTTPPANLASPFTGEPYAAIPRF